MDFGWKFSLTDTVGAETPAFNDNKWRTLNLPHDWSIESAFKADAPTGGGGGYLSTGIGWYRKHFSLSKIEGKNIRIEFDGVYQNSDVWINGHLLGNYPNGYMSFSYELTPFLKKGENIVTVRVNNSLQPNSRWYSGSGIYRHVWLNIAEPLHIAQWGTYITTPLAEVESAVIKIKTQIENTSAVSKSAVLRSIILDAKGIEVSRTESSINVVPGKNATSDQTIMLSMPSLWSLDTPTMYTLHSVVFDKGKLTDEINTPFGIRDIKYDVDKGFLLNGMHVKMNGVCLHQDAGSVGSAVPEAMWARRLETLKVMGCNAIRTSHNPVAPEFLDLCDRMGFLVQNEIFDEWKSGKVLYGYHLYFDKWSQHDLTGFIHRDRNHPSVVMWSAGNEIGEQRQENGLERLRPLIETFHKEDPTRPVTTGNDNIAADDGAAKLPFLKMLDIVGYNYVDRWHKRRELYYSLDRHTYPDWKMVGTESESIQGERGGYVSPLDSAIIRPANMASVIRAEQLWKFVSNHDYIIGDFMWTGIDYLGESKWPRKNGSAGVIDLCGFPKDAYYFYQSQWTSKPMIHVAPHWNWKGREGTIIPILVYTNCDDVELFLNGKSYGKKSLAFPREGNSGAWNKYDRPQVDVTTGDLHLSWDVPYEAGTLKAVGRREGKIVYTEVIHTTGAPASVRLTVDRNDISADQRDVAHVKVEVLDANGFVVPDAGNPIQLTVTGSGSLIGFDNGSPADHASMKSSQRSLFNGMALAIIQSTDRHGNIKISATSPNLKAALIEVRTLENTRPTALVEN
jgi:beta-galactosidase